MSCITAIAVMNMIDTYRSLREQPTFATPPLVSPQNDV